MDINEFKNELTAIVKQYATLSPDQKAYISRSTITPKTQIEIENKVFVLLTNFLSQNGIKEEKTINAAAKQLYIYFHPDRAEQRWLPVVWLEQQVFSEMNNGAHCFYLLNKIKEGLLEKNQKTKFNFDFSEQFKQAQMSKESATTYTQKFMWENLSTMLDTLKQFDQHNFEKWGNSAKEMARILPLISTSLCAGFFITEAACFFSMAFVLSKCGKWLQKNPRENYPKDLQKLIGKQISVIASSIFYFGFGVLAKLAEINLVVVNNLITYGVQVSGYLTCSKSTYVPVPKKKQDNSLSLIVSDQIKKLPLCFQLNDLNIYMIASSLEAYSQQQKKQWANSMRAGKQKSRLLQEALNEIIKIDKKEGEIIDKVEKIRGKLILLMANPQINESGKHAMKALEEAFSKCNQFINSQTAVQNEPLEPSLWDELPHYPDEQASVKAPPLMFFSSPVPTTREEKKPEFENPFMNVDF